MQTGKEIFDIISTALEEKNMPCEKHEDMLIVRSWSLSKDHIVFCMMVDEKRENVTFFSVYDFKIPKEKLIEGAVAVCKIGFREYGVFDYDLNDGSIQYHMTTWYKYAPLTVEHVKYMIDIGLASVKHQADKLHSFAKGQMTLKELFEQSNE